MIGFFNRYSSARAVFPELELLRTDSQIKSEQIGKLANETEKMLENLQRLQELEQRLKELNDLEDTSSLPTLPNAEDKRSRNFRSVVSRSYTSVDRTRSGIEVLHEALPDQEERMINLKPSGAATPRCGTRLPLADLGFYLLSLLGGARHPITRKPDFPYRY